MHPIKPSRRQIGNAIEKRNIAGVNMKALTDSQYAFKAAVRRAVTISGGPNAAAEMVRVDAPRLSRYGNIDAPEFAPVDVCFALDKAAGDPVILRAWADLLSFDLVPRDVRTLASRDLARAAGQVARESGELISAAIEAGSDGNLTPNEARGLDDAAADVEEKVIELRNIVRPAMGARS